MFVQRLSKPEDHQRPMSQRELQDAQYAFPYHYIPVVEGGEFSATQHWPWGFRYLGGLHVVLEQLDRMGFSSLVDIGCGDGRFLREVANRFPGAALMGVDLSRRAVRLAQALNPDLDYRAADITVDFVPERFEVATLIEVIEHIPPEELPRFLDAVADRLIDGGWLVLTVPHRNKPLISKHYQHFDADQLRQLLHRRFEVVRIVPFDRRSRRSPGAWLINRVLGAKGRWMLVTNRRVLRVLYRLYVNRYLYCARERDCGRLALVCSRPPRLDGADVQSGRRPTA
jgi:SAM-dependent methyltransferase